MISDPHPAFPPSDLRWELVFEQSPLSIQVFARDGRTIRFNPAWQKLFGLTTEQAYAFNVLENADLIESGAIHVIRKAFEGEVVYVPPVPFPVVGRPEENRWVGGTLFPVITPDGVLREVVVIHHDITELKEAEETMRRLNEILEERVATRTSELKASEEYLRSALDAERQLHRLKTSFIGMVSGADDYLSKPIAISDLLGAICSRLARMAGLIRKVPDFSDTAPLRALGLTMKEAEVLLWVTQGKSNAECALILGSTESTVKKHLEHIFGKLGVEKRGAASLIALEALSS